ncbi:hypothetical protein C8T65DRAFT_72735 [Cerioporus squamosus]|nr:hypothetical protein C8T65DRAFT_72735 [Cerioporus squamosus]
MFPRDSDLTSDCASDSSSFKAIVAAIVNDTDPTIGTGRSSGSLESSASTSTDSNTSTGSSLSAPSLDTSHSTDSTASAASSTTPSPCPSILIRSSSSLTVPGTRSGSSSPNISFAPLPQIEPRKRNSSRQLGVAARSHLLRHRRMLREQEQGYDSNSVPYPYGPGSGVEGGQGYPEHMEEGGPVEIREAQAGVDADEEMNARGHRSRAVSDPSEDALASLGKLMKGAGRALWKSVSMRDIRAKEKEAAAATAAEGGQDDCVGGDRGQRPRGGSLRGKNATAPLPRNNAIHLFDHDEEHPPSVEGGVWEEEIPEESWKKLLSDTPATSEPAEDDKASEHRPSAELGRNGSQRTSIVAVRTERKSSSTSRTR